jgi:hypothetical protein
MVLLLQTFLPYLFIFRKLAKNEDARETLLWPGTTVLERTVTRWLLTPPLAYGT